MSNALAAPWIIPLHFLINSFSKSVENAAGLRDKIPSSSIIKSLLKTMEHVLGTIEACSFTFLYKNPD